MGCQHKRKKKKYQFIIIIIIIIIFIEIEDVFLLMQKYDEFYMCCEFSSPMNSSLPCCAIMFAIFIGRGGPIHVCYICKFGSR
jgi:hypothetical protein